MLLAPVLTLVGFATNEAIVGLLAEAATVTVAALVTEPALFVAVSVYAVVTDGVTLAEPLAAGEVNPPGLIAMLVALFETQLSVLLAPALMLAGFATNELIVGAVAGFAVGGFVTPEQDAKPDSKTTNASKRSCSGRRKANRLPVPR